MKKALILALLVIVFCDSNLKAQIHDFDSLINQNEDFANIAKQIGDTLDLFNSTDALEVTLISDFKNLIKRKYKNEYQDAVFKILFNDSVQVSRDIKIIPRGKVRKSTCFIPPIKLNFPKKKAFIKQLESFDKMKMVLDCKRGENYEQYLLSEYYAYKLQNIINDFSLRVRLLHVTYIDLSGKYKDITRYAFIIESMSQFADRHNAIRIETKSIKDRDMNLEILSDAYLFQYLIGNTDWSIPALHNIMLIKSIDHTNPRPYPIPYDFDYAGIVNTLYAIPDEQLGTESVRERVYRGVCIQDNFLLQSRTNFINKKEKIYTLYQQDELLNKSNKRSTINYIDDFYSILEKENAFKRHIIDACR